MQVRWLNGKGLGHIEKSFLSRLRPNDVFLFAGRTLQLVRVRDMTAYVRASDRRTRNVPRWQGGRMPLSTELADATLELFSAWQNLEAAQSQAPEVELLRPLLELQGRTSRLPHATSLLAERALTREGSHLFVFPFAGRLVHEGLATLLAYRLSRRAAVTFTLSFNDYGFELLSERNYRIDAQTLSECLRHGGMGADLLGSVNLSEGAKRAFCDIARIAGLITPGLPGRRKANRQLQASSSLIFEVLRQFDPQNRLIEQARIEVLTRQLEGTRLAACLRRLETLPLTLLDTGSLSPLAFPLWAERLQSQILSSEGWQQRVERMAMRLKRAAAAHGD